MDLSAINPILLIAAIIAAATLRRCRARTSMIRF